MTTRKSENRKDLEDKILRQIRDIRALIRPEVLTRAEDALAPAETQTAQPVDKQKTYRMLMEFMELKKDRQDVLKQTAEMLKDEI